MSSFLLFLLGALLLLHSGAAESAKQDEEGPMDNADENMQKEESAEEVVIGEPAWKQVYQDGYDRHSHSGVSDLSVLGNAAHKYSDRSFHIDIDDKNNEWQIPDSWLAIPSTSTILICTMLFVAMGLFVMYRQKQSGYQYSKVSTTDDNLLTA